MSDLSPFRSSGARFAWDSTTLGTFQACPRRYYYLYVCGIASPGFALDLEFGILYHKGLELWEKRGRDDAALISTIRELLSRASPDFRAVDPHHQKSLPHLIRAVVWYADEHREDNLQTIVLNGKPALEQSFKIELGDYLLCGHLDRAVTFHDKIYFVDRKTTKKTLNSDYFMQFKLSLQMDIYALGSRIIFSEPAVGGIIEAVQLAVSFARFGRSFLDKPQDSLSEDLDDIMELMSAADHAHATGFWPRNKQACFLCGFKDICSRPASSREVFIKSLYKPMPVWNPLVPR